KKSSSSLVGSAAQRGPARIKLARIEGDVRILREIENGLGFELKPPSPLDGEQRWRGNGTELSNDVFDHFPIVIGEAEIAPVVPVSELFVVEPQKGEHRSVQIVDVHFVLGSP